MLLWRTDILMRAVPWSKLIVSGKTRGADLNASMRERIIVIFAYLLLLTGMVSVLAPVALWAFLASVAIYAGLNLRFYNLLARCGGVRLLLGGVLLHWLYHLYASAVFVFVYLKHFVRGKKYLDQAAGAKAERSAS